MSRYKNIFELIEEIKPKTIMEIGTWNGNHAEQMIRLAQKFNNPITYYGFDLFEDFNLAKKEFCPKQPASFKQVNQKIKATGCEYRLIKGNTHNTLASFQCEPVNFIFMDGGHSLETIHSDWKNIRKFINKDTTVLLDDYYLNIDYVGCQNLVKSLISSDKWLVEPLEPIDECNDGTQMIKVNLNQQEN